MNKNRIAIIFGAFVIALVCTIATLYIYPTLTGHQLGEPGYALITFTYTPDGIIVKNIGNARLDNFTFSATLQSPNSSIVHGYGSPDGGFPLSLAAQESTTTWWLPTHSPGDADLKGVDISSGMLGYNNLHNFDYLNPSNAYYPYPTYNFTYSSDYGWYVRLEP